MSWTKISEERKKIGLTQAELAEKCSLTQSMISKYESGYPVPPKVLQDIARVLGISSNDLKSSIKAPETDLFDEVVFNKKLKEIRSYPPEEKAAILNYLNSFTGLYKYKRLFLKGTNMD